MSSERYVTLQVNRGTQEVLNGLTLFDGEPFGLLTQNEKNELTIKLYIGVGGKAVPVSTCAGLTPISIAGTETLSAGGSAEVINEGTPTNVLLRFRIPKGDTGQQGVQGMQGEKGIKGDTGPQGMQGATGESAYQVWLSSGNLGTIADYLASLKGAKGDKGDKGDKGERGLAAFTVKAQGANTLAYGSPPTVQNVGTEADQILVFGIPEGPKGQTGAAGARGESAYQVWLSAGNLGTVTDYLNSLKGEAGPQGLKGDTGSQGPQGLKGDTGSQGAQGVQGPKGDIGPQGPPGELLDVIDLGTY